MQGGAYERIWAMFAKRGMTQVCHEHPDGWHHYERIDGSFVDKGRCKHDHADLPIAGDRCLPPGYGEKDA